MPTLYAWKKRNVIYPPLLKREIVPKKGHFNFGLTQIKSPTETFYAPSIGLLTDNNWAREKSRAGVLRRSIYKIRTPPASGGDILTLLKGVTF